MRAARHGVGRGVGTKLSGWTRRRADTQFCQPSARPPRRSLPWLSPETTPTPHPLPIRSRPAQPPPTACSRGTAPRRSPHRHARDADNDQHRRAEVAGSIQMSKPGSIGVSAEGRVHLKPAHLQPRLKLRPEGFRFILGPAVHQSVISIPTPRQVGVCPCHPKIKCVMQKEIG